MLDSATFLELVNLLTPLMPDQDRRESLLGMVFIGKTHNIDLSGGAVDATQRIVKGLFEYGNIEPDRPALVVLIDIVLASDLVGVDKAEQFRRLRTRVQMATEAQYGFDDDVEGSVHVYIAYARANMGFVEWLRTDLKGAGISLWTDRIGLKQGTPDWEQALRDAVQIADMILLVTSPSARRSSYVRDQLALAKMYNKPVIPIWADGETWADSAPSGLVNAGYVDLRDHVYDTGLAELIDVLRGQAPLPQAPTAPVATVHQAVEPPADPRNPYKGLRAFRNTPEDQRDFFGRADLVRDLLNAINEFPGFLAVVGASGSGKSSVIMAGLLPALQRGAIPECMDWFYLDPFVPGMHPLENLTIALAGALKQSQRSVREDLENPNARGLHTLTRQLVSGSPGRRVVLYIDQAEELFTISCDEAERRQFIDLITTAVNEATSVVTVILSMRADFYDRPLAYPELGVLMEAHTRTVMPMSLADLYDAILRPTQLADVQLEFDEGLVSELVFAVRDEAGALPLMQFALDQLFQRREGRRLTWAAYNTIGGVRGALAKHAEETYSRLPSDDHRRLARALFLRLIEPGATELDTTRRRASQTELVLADLEATARLAETKTAFVDARLLTTDRVGDHETVEVSHEAIIREWSRLAGWLREARDDVHWQKKVSEDAADWRRENSPMDYGGFYRYGMLSEAQEWAARNVPSADEQAFIEASAKVEMERRIHDEATARQVRNLQTARRNLLIMAIIGIGATMVAIVAAVLTLSTTRGQIAEANQAETQAAVVQVAAEGRAATAEARSNQVNATLTPIAGTLIAGATQIAAVPPTQTALAASIQQGEARIESLRLASDAAELLNEGGNTETAALLSIRALETAYTEQADTALTRALDRLFTRRALVGAHELGITALAVSPIAPLLFSAGRDNIARLWNAELGEPLRTLDTGGTLVNAALFSADGHQLLTGEGDGRVRLWDVQTGRLRQTFENQMIGINAVAFSPAGDRVAAGGLDGTMTIWDAETSEVISTSNANSGPINDLAFSDDGRLVLSGVFGYIVLTEAETGETLNTLEAHLASVYSTAFSPDGGFAATGGADGTVFLWDARTFVDSSSQPIATLAGHTSAISALIFSDENHLLTASEDGTAIYWNVQSRTRERAFVGPAERITAAALTADGGRLYTGGDEGTIRIWNAGATLPERSLPGNVDGVRSIAYSPDGRYILTGGNETSVRLWDAATRQQIQEFLPDDETMNASTLMNVVRFSPDGSVVLAGDFSGFLTLWNIDGTLLQRITDPESSSAIVEAVFTFDGRQVIAASEDGTVRVWDVATGTLLQLLQVLTPNADGIIPFAEDVTLSANGEHLLLALSDGSVQKWNIETGELEQDYGQIAVSLSTLAVSPDGRYLLTSIAPGVTTLWNGETGEKRHSLAGHAGIITAVAFSADGRYVLTGGEDRTARLWDLETGDLVRVFGGHSDRVEAVTFSPDQQLVLSGGSDGLVRMWDLDYQNLLTYACTRVFRDLVVAERSQFALDDAPTCDTLAQIASNIAPSG
jgi:WD40 repeat protein